MARSSNITLTSLAELRRTTVDELLTLRLGESRLRLAHLRKRLGAVGQIDRRGHGVLSRSYRQAPGHWDVIKLHAAIAIAATGIERVETGRWPAPTPGTSPAMANAARPTSRPSSMLSQLPSTKWRQSS